MSALLYEFLHALLTCPNSHCTELYNFKALNFLWASYICHSQTWINASLRCKKPLFIPLYSGPLKALGSVLCVKGHPLVIVLLHDCHGHLNICWGMFTQAHTERHALMESTIAANWTKFLRWAMSCISLWLSPLSLLLSLLAAWLQLMLPFSLSFSIL